ncbi:hypothetical protein [Shewanella ulleungensis]|jgi:hypothetical protein|uniref:Lipoprotein n=1 Tax=Shewanella ulleungensis TaxID=2282699 RepID=A0ABQ2QYQ1_9GAMM|nr:hypothetical protein [Shewanella ulleungensis]MCL1152412.1 hypothetical protein [Shewanella ulleungensis]GGQ02375.1 hypothetical protein GCM10009410_39540 [Shewanella ulleungensis]
MRKLSSALCVIVLLLSSCKSGKTEFVNDSYEKYIISCIDAYKSHGDGNVIEQANRVYVAYADSNLIDVFFSRGDVGDFTERSSDYMGLLYCGGMVNEQFEVYRLKYANSSKDLFSKPGFEVGAVNAKTCGIAKQRWYILDGFKLEYKGEKIFDCRK